MAKTIRKREAKRSAATKLEKGAKAVPIPAPAPAQEFPAPPPPPPTPKSYKELIEREGLIVEHAMVTFMRRITVRKGRHASACFVTPGSLTPQQWGSKGRMFHLLLSQHKGNPDFWPHAKARLIEMVGAVNFEQLERLFEEKVKELAEAPVVPGVVVEAYPTPAAAADRLQAAALAAGAF